MTNEELRIAEALEELVSLVEAVISRGIHLYPGGTGFRAELGPETLEDEPEEGRIRRSW